MKKIYFIILGVFISLNIFAQTNATIAQIQGTGAASPFVGDSVIVTAIVCAVDTNYGDNDGYFIQDAAGARNGIYVFDFNNAASVSVGDEVTFQAEVSEYYDFTELSYVKNFSVLSTGNAVTATEVTATEASSEDYEGVLVTVKNLTCVSTPTSGTYGIWDATNNSVVVKIDDFICSMYAYTPTLSVVYDVTGAVDYSFSLFHVNPRSAADVTISSGIEDHVIKGTRIYPIPASDKFILESGKSVYSVEMFNVLGESVYSNAFSAVNQVSVDVSDYETGMYMLKVNYRKTSAVYRVIVK